VAVIDHFAHQWWLLPVLGVIVGWTTNLLGMYVIFEPTHERKIGPLRQYGLFLRRQAEVSDVYAGLIADEVVTLENIGNFLLDGPRGDRTRQLLEEAMEPAIDRAAGLVRPAVRVAVGTDEYDSVRAAVAHDAVGQTMKPFRDPDFSRNQSDKIRNLFAERMRELPPDEFVEMLRSAFKEDEWMLYFHGAVMGGGGGIIHLLLFGT
jgi:uncharacterized membrane protein YheB (UPF0754 family)